MRRVESMSLAATLDAVNEAFFYGRPLAKSQREQAAKCFAGRHRLLAERIPEKC